MSSSNYPPKTDPQNADALREDLKTRIFMTALRHFATKGYEKTSMRDIAEEAGATKPMIYYYFGNKKTLYETLRDELVKNFKNELLRVRRSPGSLADKLLAIVTLHYTNSHENPDVVRFLLSYAYAPGESDPLEDFRPFYEAQAEIVAQLLDDAELNAGIQLPERQTFIDFFWSAIGACCMSQGYCPAPTLDTETPKKVFELLWHGVTGVQQTIQRPNVTQENP